MKTILTADRLRELVDYDKETGVFTWRMSRRRCRPGSKAGYTNEAGYVFIRIDKRLYRAHRLAWLWSYGEFPALEVDHINRNPSDNSLANLREVNSSQNKQNTLVRSDNRSGYKGVYKHSQTGKWTAQIAINGAAKHLGCFASPEEASAAYNNAAANLHTHNPCANALFGEVACPVKPATTGTQRPAGKCPATAWLCAIWARLGRSIHHSTPVASTNRPRRKYNRPALRGSGRGRAMNCKQDDLALVVACKNNPRLVGRLVECVRVVRQDEVVSGFRWKAIVGGPSWLVQAAGGGLLPWGNHMVAQRVVADANLRPIRDPGDDARDETLEWLPVPSREGQPA